MQTRLLTQEKLKCLDLTKAAELVNIVTKQKSEVTVRGEGRTFHLGSLISTVVIASIFESPLTLVVNGTDEAETMDKLLEAWDA